MTTARFIFVNKIWEKETFKAFDIPLINIEEHLFVERLSIFYFFLSDYLYCKVLIKLNKI